MSEVSKFCTCAKSVFFLSFFFFLNLITVNFSTSRGESKQGLSDSLLIYTLVPFLLSPLDMNKMKKKTVLSWLYHTRHFDTNKNLSQNKYATPKNPDLQSQSQVRSRVRK